MSDPTNTPSCENSGCPDMPKPTPEHEWLQRFVGEWISEGEAYMAPDQPPLKLAGIEKVRSLGFWVVGEISSTLEHFPYEQIYTIGFNSGSGKYIGSVVDSMMGHMWLSEGSVENNILTLEMEGPCPMNGYTRFRETTEFKTPDHKVFTSHVLSPDGEWRVGMVFNCHRRK